MYFDIPKEESSIIKVIGVGGGGCNAVNHMFEQGIKDVNFVICNTDQQALDMSPVPVKIQLGPSLTKGRGAGSHPHMGKEATMESLQEIKNILEKNTEMIFVTAGMGGGTGTGGAPVIAKTARDMGILTIGIVSLPFNFEGRRRKNQADDGLEELKKNVDAILIISNDKLREMYGNLPWNEAFAHADDVLTTAAKGIAEIITVPGYINVDFEDVKTVLRNSGLAIMGSGKANGENRALKAVEGALASPLLNDNDIRGAKSILLNITSGTEPVLMDEISEITEFVQLASGNDCDIIWGNCVDETVGNNLVVTVIATGFETEEERKAREKSKKVVVSHVDLEELKKNDNGKLNPQELVQEKIQDEPTEIKAELKNLFSVDEPKKVMKEESNPKQFVFDFNAEMQQIKSDDDLSLISNEQITEEEAQTENEPHELKTEEQHEITSLEDQAPITEYPMDEIEKEKTEMIVKQEMRDIKPPKEHTHYEKISREKEEASLMRNEDKLQMIQKAENDRVKRLRSMSLNLNNLEEYEKTPAYLRREVELKDMPPSSENSLSDYGVTENNDELEIKKNNKFLHGNVD